MAGRIPQPFIDDLIDRTDIVELVSSRTALKKSGKNYSACCPFHDEKSPSFTVSPQKQFYYCFGCGAGGNVIGFLMEHDHLDFPAAVETLAKTAGMEIPREESNPRAEAAQRRRLDIYSELEKASGFYRATLRKHQPAIDYLKTRGLTGEIAKEFALGYVPDEWDSLIKLCGENHQALQLMVDGGMLIKRDQKEGQASENGSASSQHKQRNYYDRFRDRVMFPIRDQRGRTIAFGGRVLGDQKPKYLNSPETPVFHKSRELYGLYEVLQQKQKTEELIVVEGYMDVVALAQHGVRNAVATLGTSAGAAHMDRVFRHVSKVVFCFDGDKAGRAAAHRALDACLPVMLDGRQARFLFLPDGEDPDTIVRTEGDAGFNKRVDQSKTLSNFIFDLAGADLDLSKPDQRALFAHKALRYLNQLPKGLLQSILLQRLADETGIEKQDLINIAVPKPTPPPEPPSHTESIPEQGEDDHPLIPEEKGLSDKFKRLLALILQVPRLALHEKLSEELLNREDPKKIVLTIREMVQKNPDTGFVHVHGHFMAQIPKVAKQLSQIIGSSISDDLENEQIEVEFDDMLERFLHRFRRSEVKQRIRQIAAIPYEELTPDLRKEQIDLHNKLKAH